MLIPKIEKTLAVLAAALLAVIVLVAPLDVLVSTFMPDDVFYYLQTARVFAGSGVSSFDGINPSNGYQPLWFLASTVGAWLFDGGEPMIRLMLAVSAVLTVLAMWRLFEYGRAMLDGPLALVVVAISLLFVRTMMNGLETALYMLLFVTSMSAWHVLWTKDREDLGVGLRFGAGLVFGLAFLARTDFALFLVPMGIAILVRVQRQTKSIGSTIRLLWPVAAPIAAIAGSYLLVNLVSFGHLMPVSGAAKQFHSMAGWEDATRRLGTFGALWENALFLFSEPGYRFARVALFLPFFNLMLANLSGQRRAAADASAIAVMGIGLWCMTAFYVISFHGGFTRTFWYYGPHAIIAGLAIAQAALLVSERLRAPGIVAVLLAGAFTAWTLAWPVASGLPLWGAIAALFALSLVAWKGQRRVGVAAGILVFALVLLWFKRSGMPVVSLTGWVATVLALAAAGVTLAALNAKASRAGASLAAVAVLVATTGIHAANLRAEATAKPAGWNYHLLQGARWVDGHLPVDATIWSGSAGILGYFSNRRVINTDGLINSYEYLDDVLRAGKRGEYVKQFGYTIDAFGSQSPSTQFPGGCLVPLPELGLAPFPDGAEQRKLGVYQMHPSGLVQCVPAIAPAAVPADQEKT